MWLLHFGSNGGQKQAYFQTTLNSFVGIADIAHDCSEVVVCDVKRSLRRTDPLKAVGKVIVFRVLSSSVPAMVPYVLSVQQCRFFTAMYYVIDIEDWTAWYDLDIPDSAWITIAQNHDLETLIEIQDPLWQLAFEFAAPDFVQRYEIT